MRNTINPNKQKNFADRQKKKKYEYQKFTPYTDVDSDAYQAAFDYVFEYEYVRNVAISGVYGSIKSSLIELYRKQIKRIQIGKQTRRCRPELKQKVFIGSF
ncbi:hypothetical protein [Snodgrassella sp.]|uniref:YobI family P-loop NTPase n=1 Tax=Snodgrassella sp. TaxID=2815304 RepID=UPI00338F7F01